MKLTRPYQPLPRVTMALIFSFLRQLANVTQKRALLSSLVGAGSDVADVVVVAPAGDGAVVAVSVFTIA